MLRRFFVVGGQVADEERLIPLLEAAETPAIRNTLYRILGDLAETSAAIDNGLPLLCPPGAEEAPGAGRKPQKQSKQGSEGGGRKGTAAMMGRAAAAAAAASVTYAGVSTRERLRLLRLRRKARAKLQLQLPEVEAAEAELRRKLRRKR